MQLARWTKAEDDAILAAGAALADRSIWQPADCPNRGTVQGQDAKKQFSRLGKRAREQADEPPPGVAVFVSVESTTKKACCAERYTPMRERAERASVSFNSTPVELRQIVDENPSPGAVIRARVSIHSLKKTRSQTIRRAEIREQLLRAEFNRRCDPTEP